MDLCSKEFGPPAVSHVCDKHVTEFSVWDMKKPANRSFLQPHADLLGLKICKRVEDYCVPRSEMANPTETLKTANREQAQHFNGI